MSSQPIEYSSQAASGGSRSLTDKPTQPELLDFGLPLNFLFPDKKFNIIWKHGYPPFVIAGVIRLSWPEDDLSIAAF